MCNSNAKWRVRIKRPHVLFVKVRVYWHFDIWKYLQKVFDTLHTKPEKKVQKIECNISNDDSWWKSTMMVRSFLQCNFQKHMLNRFYQSFFINCMFHSHCCQMTDGTVTLKSSIKFSSFIKKKTFFQAEHMVKSWNWNKISTFFYVPKSHFAKVSKIMWFSKCKWVIFNCWAIIWGVMFSLPVTPRSHLTIIEICTELQKKCSSWNAVKNLICHLWETKCCVKLNQNPYAIPRETQHVYTHVQMAFSDFYLIFN